MKIRSHRRGPRAAATLAAVCAFALLAAACGDDDSASGDTTASTAATADATEPTTGGPAGTAADSADTAATDGAFPVSIENMFGTTVIESKPERVVSIGYTEGDYVLALGVTPVAIRDWYGDQPGGLWPWAAEAPAADDSIRALQSDALNVEQIAELDPDVIVAMVSEIEQADYDKLTQIAPVLAQTDGYVQFGTPWDVLQLTIGKALGLETEAQAIVDDVSAQIADAAAAHPDWAGKTANFVVPATDGTWYAYTDQDNRGRLLTELGFVIPQPILDLAGDLFYAQGSGEQLAMVDADLLTYNTFVADDRAIVDALPLWSTIPAVTDGRSLFIDGELAGAMSFATTLSLPYAVEGLVPQIESTLGS
jgi:ABC-type Fe3+-hydroxamate transport system substrate-binding protein